MGTPFSPKYIPYSYMDPLGTIQQQARGERRHDDSLHQEEAQHEDAGLP